MLVYTFVSFSLVLVLLLTTSEVLVALILVLAITQLNELEVKEKCQVEITNRFAALENLDVDEDVNRAWGKH